MTGVLFSGELYSESLKGRRLWGCWTWDDEGMRAIYIGPDEAWAMQIAAWLEERGRPNRWGRLEGGA